MRWFALRLPAALAVCVGIHLLPSSSVSAATITVTGAGDASAVDGAVTLREAIMSINNGANVNADVVAVGAYGTNDQIHFNIPGAAQIQPTSNLPAITKTVVIDGYTQPGSSPNNLAAGDNAVIKVDISGVNISNICIGLSVQSSNTTIRGVAIHLCGAPLELRGGSGNKVLGNFLGIDATGSVVDWPSVAYTLYVENSTNATIGGTAPGDRNVISGGRLGGGVFITALGGNFSTGNVLQGNFIGTNAAGTAALPNQSGVIIGVNSTNNVIGGTAAGAGNLISGNMTYGVSLGPLSSASNVVQGNRIGTVASGSAALGNGTVGLNGAGVAIAGTDNMIGGTAPGAGNVIAYNVGPAAGAPQQSHGQGVVVFNGSGNSIRGNSIFSNSGIGIDLKDDGVTANDDCDNDFGANNLQNNPVLTRAVLGTGTTILGSLNAAASTSYQVDFYSNGTCDGSGSGEGQSYLGSAMVMTDASCKGNFIAAVPGGVSPQDKLTATATDPSNNTSEFSACISLQAQYYTVTPCRLADTRNTAGPYGGPALNANASRTFVIGGQCGIPPGAQAVSFNFAVTQPTALGDLRAYPNGGELPLTSTINWRAGQTRTNNAIIPLGPGGEIGVHVDQASGTVHLIIDVNGYMQ
jgi:hypothetical protein